GAVVLVGSLKGLDVAASGEARIAAPVDVVGAEALQFLGEIPQLGIVVDPLLRPELAEGESRPPQRVADPLQGREAIDVDVAVHGAPGVPQLPEALGA